MASWWVWSMNCCQARDTQVREPSVETDVKSRMWRTISGGRAASGSVIVGEAAIAYCRLLIAIREVDVPTRGCAVDGFGITILSVNCQSSFPMKSLWRRHVDQATNQHCQ